MRLRLKIKDNHTGPPAITSTRARHRRFSPTTISRMRADYDIAVVGAGIHGAGVAQAASAAGYSVLVLERDAVAAGTSSRSSKLIHGGLRYLESGRWRLVRESLHERELLLRLAPTLVRRLPFHIPVYTHTTRSALALRAGLALYAVLGGLGKYARFKAVPRSGWDQFDGLDIRGLKTVFSYYDAHTDDAALTRAVMRSAQSLGAQLECPARFIHARTTADRIEIAYQAGTRTGSCHARVLINAAGPWVNQVLSGLMPAPTPLPVELVQGSHIVLPGSLARGAYYIEAHDRRAVFALPWRNQTLVGTTETRYRGDPAAAQPLAEEIAYLQNSFARYFPERRTDILSSFAGLRVLPQDTRPVFYRARDTVLHIDPAMPRVLSIYGGKLTGYRATAARALARVQLLLPGRRVRADTARLALDD